MKFTKSVLATTMAAGIALSPMAFAQKAPLAEPAQAQVHKPRPLSNEAKLAWALGITAIAYAFVAAYSLCKAAAKKEPQLDGIAREE